MEIVLNIETSFESVFLINGRFFEQARIKVEATEIVYITVLPLDATLSSYTIKLLGFRPLNGSGLSLVYKLTENCYYIRMLERHNYIYTTKKLNQPSVTNNIFKFFKAVKQKQYNEARSLLTEELSGTIDNNSLDGFFQSYSDIIENKGYVTAPYNSYFLIDNNNTANLYVFETKAGQIDNIYEFPSQD